ncbi:SRPBCC family protein [Hydrotalea sp.]|uniref:SRPBCC family protein n=2 Tax=Hydrotalea sp. TaxID=2881279 RepID=UPI002603F087|nr:SRPBCC family protein [Hydrotalea sp.]
MRLLKQAFFSILFLAILVQVIALLFPSRIIVSRAITIHAPADSVRPYLQNMYGWQKWIAGMQDSAVHLQSQTQAQIGNRDVQIEKITSDSVVSVWHSAKSHLLISTMQMLPASNGTATVVQWQYEQFLKWYPWERFGSLMSDKIIGGMLEQNLSRLQQLVEKQH